MSQPQLSQVLKPISDAAATSSGRGRQCRCQRASQCQSGGLGNARGSTQVSRTWFGEAVVERADCGQRNEHQGRCASERGRHHAMQVRASGRQQAAGCWLAGWLAVARGRIFLPAGDRLHIAPLLLALYRKGFTVLRVRHAEGFRLAPPRAYKNKFRHWCAVCQANGSTATGWRAPASRASLRSLGRPPQRNHHSPQCSICSPRTRRSRCNNGLKTRLAVLLWAYLVNHDISCV
jgi:hypothetical protein